MSTFFAYAVLFCYLVNPICSIVQLKSGSSSFPDSPARFSRGLNGSIICGGLRLADPLDACSSLLNEVEYSDAESATIALIVRGKCAFEEKIRNAQEAGFRAAIVYDDQRNHNLISMMGNPEGIRIYAVFVSNVAGEILREHAQAVGDECCIISVLDETAWTVLVISFISVLAVMSLLATIFFTYNHWRTSKKTKPVVDVKVFDILPSITFGSQNLISHIGETCVICLEDYKYGENLKVLPCQHDFHASCVKSWLTKWATFCPICKHDIRT
ncbi:putative E3 ubiquitin ligase [Handroanthus impetiginosus]|uniref:Putative E3 ubiquitin ligase n=1 Tax=Handroanthus impetiginosus TaxID=429701 RepID=A0A2G9GJL3_9LAMI|nr:putative E3 ubiquitin ligase [Handroanthus impetiginosus]